MSETTDDEAPMSYFSFEIKLPGKAEAELAHDAFRILLDGAVVPDERTLERANTTPEALAAMGSEDFFPPDERYGKESSEAYDLAADLLRDMLAMPSGSGMVDEFAQHGASLLGFDVLPTDAGDALEFCHDGDSGLPDAAAYAASALLQTHGGKPVGWTWVDPHERCAGAYVCSAEGIAHLDVDRWIERGVQNARQRMEARQAPKAARRASPRPGGP